MTWYQWPTSIAFATWHAAFCLTLGIPSPGTRKSDNALILATCWTVRYVLLYNWTAGGLFVSNIATSVGTAQALTACATQDFSFDPVNGTNPLTLVNLPIPRSIPPTWLGQSTAGATG